MGRKLAFLILILVLTALACSVPGGLLPGPATEPPAPPPDGVTPDAGVIPGDDPTVTPEVMLPPPAVAPPFQVVYEKLENIWVWTEAGGSVQLTSAGTDTEPRLSADGMLIAFRRGEEIWVMNRDGSGPRPVIASAFLGSVVDPAVGRGSVQWFEWDPLSNDLYFGTSTMGDPFTMPNFDLWSTGTDGVSLPGMIKAANAGGPVTFSPDGQYYTITQATQILLRSRDGSTDRVALTYALVQTYSEWFYLPEVVWFADSSEFRTLIPAHDSLGDPFEGTYFWSVPVSGSPVEMAGFIAVPAFMNFPRISPDGLNVAYMTPNGANHDLYLNGFYIGNELLTTYTANAWGLVGWAADSTHVVYWLDDPRSLWYGDLSTPSGTHFTDTANAENVRWVDVSRFLFISDGELRLGTPGGTSTYLDSPVNSGYDFYGFLP